MLDLVSLRPEELGAASALWIPFVLNIAKRTREHPSDLVAEIMLQQTQLHLIKDGDLAVGLCGTRLLKRGDGRICEIKWLTGVRAGADWNPILEKLETHVRAMGCSGVRAPARLGWKQNLKDSGYRITHIVGEKEF